MRDTKFSKSPWMVTPQGPADADGMGICSMWGGGEELRANVDLIAAAPDMYSLLNDILNNYETDTHIDNQINVVLAKARGE